MEISHVTGYGVIRIKIRSIKCVLEDPTHIFSVYAKNPHEPSIGY